MTKLKASELISKTFDELQAILDDTRGELFKLNNAAKLTKKPEQPEKIRMLKKNIARLLTVIREKQLTGNLS